MSAVEVSATAATSGTTPSALVAKKKLANRMPTKAELEQLATIDEVAEWVKLNGGIRCP